MAIDLTRREFFKGGSALTLSLSLERLCSRNSKAYAQQASIQYPYRNWEDLYRKKWRWDKVVKGTHYVNCWYQSSCNWNVYVKDGIVWREEQVANYPQTNSEVPDFNPRGCQKGACHSHRMYEPGRIKYPLKRVGSRGEGRWKRISWDEALTEIADKMVEVITKEGPDTILWDPGTFSPFWGAAQGVASVRLAISLDTPILEIDLDIGDDHQGAAVTMGKGIAINSGDEWFYSDIFLIWGGNPFYTHIPNSHFIAEARYNGTRIITISPEYSPSSIHSDLWIPINIGTDAAFGLSMAQVIVSEKLYNEGFIKEQTDLSLLVREDNRKFLRQKDIKEGGAEDVFYTFDLTSKTIKEISKTSLNLDGVNPALEGEYEAETLQGKIKVRPVFEFLKERLNDYTPEKASQITGVHPDVIRNLARDIAKARAVTNITQSNFSKFYHGFEMERAQILVSALCGHFGKKGSGYNAFAFIIIDPSTVEVASYPSLPLVEAEKEFKKQIAPRVKELEEKGYTEEMIAYEFDREYHVKKFIVSSILDFYFHGGTKDLMKDIRKWDPYLKRNLDEYIEESLKKGWQYVEPAPGKPPRIFFAYGGNVLRRIRGYHKLIEHLLPKLDLLIAVDWRMSTTGLYADYILPIPSYYEKHDLRGWIGGVAPFLHALTKAVEPVGESKPDWWVFCTLAKKIQERAKQKGISTFKDREGKERRLDNLYEHVTYGRNYTEVDDEKFVGDYVKIMRNIGKKVSWNDLEREGITKFTDIGRHAYTIGSATDMKPNETTTTYTWHTDKKIPWPTLTRRMQFYIDHELYLELGEELPVHKDVPKAGGDYPLKMTGGHARWSIHSVWRDHSYMLRLQRGVPVMYMNTEDAKSRGIKDGEEVRVKNDINSFHIQIKLSPTVRPGQVIVYHAWEPFQFKEGKSHQTLIPSPINPIELAGDYFHLRPITLFLSPGQNDRGTRVEIEKI